MSTRRERRDRRKRLSCRNCGVYKARHFDPWTHTYVCRAA